MDLYLRQVALVAYDLEPAIDQLEAMFGTPICFRDDGVAKFGLKNALAAIGSQFIEIVSPTQKGTTAERYLEKRKGDGGYMLIFQCPDKTTQDACETNAANQRVRVAWERPEVDGRIMQLHPADTGGTFLEIDHHQPFEPEGLWPPAGTNWQKHINIQHATGITGAEIQSPDPAKLAERWAAIMDIELRDGFRGPVLPLANGEIRFVDAVGNRGEGLTAIDIHTPVRAPVLFAARNAGLKITDNSLEWCGVVLNLV
jgi:hypothetical protein